MDIPPAQIDALRAFNRFYTRRIGVLGEQLLGTPFSLPQARLLWELAHRDGVTAATLSRELELDPGYLSRLLRELKARGLVSSARATGDARQLRLTLTAAGRRAFAPLDRRSKTQAQALLNGLVPTAREALVSAMSTIQALLGTHPGAPVLRSPRSGDMGWVVARHGALYHEEYGWDARFEALVARITADFVDRFDPAREACWIAERAGVNAGCVFLVQARDDAGQPQAGTAQLRMLLVEPAARGCGLGDRLVGECTRFARQARYRRIRLWTNSVLHAARHLYERHGYVRVAEESHHSFGHALVGETWELALPASRDRDRQQPQSA